VTKIF